MFLQPDSECESQSRDQPGIGCRVDSSQVNKNEPYTNVIGCIFIDAQSNIETVAYNKLKGGPDDGIDSYDLFNKL